MFERYTEKARRTIFFARYEASQFGSPYIEPEFLLLGLLREAKALSDRLFHSHTTPEAIRSAIEKHHPSKKEIATSVDLPLSNEAKHVLAYAAEEAERLGHKFIGTDHLLLGILREERSFAAKLLNRNGINLAALREDIAKNQPADIPSNFPRNSSLGFFQLVLKVANLEASIDFYKKLGFTVVGVRGTGTAVLTNGGCNLKLDQNLAADHTLSFSGGNINSLATQLQAAGIQLEESPRSEANGITSASLRDPDGNIITLSGPHGSPSFVRPG
jgi:catechol 2,3-dioxygenase-like lactoylglutathione lyase family enzyme